MPDPNHSDRFSEDIPDEPAQELKPTIFYHNLSGANTKTAALNDFLSSHPDDILCVTETWFNLTTIIPLIIHGTDHRIFHRDRNTPGGGVARFVPAKLNPLPASDYAHHATLESISVKIQDLTITTVYWPPGKTQSAIDEIREVTNVNGRVIILGDFNMPLVLWHWADGVVSPFTANAPPIDRSAVDIFLESLFEQSSTFTRSPIRSGIFKAHRAFCLAHTNRISRLYLVAVASPRAIATHATRWYSASGAAAALH